MIKSQTCSLCKEVMSPENAKEFCVDIPQIGKRLIFTACVACQEKARTNTLVICLGCKSISWYPCANFSPSGIMYEVKFQCNNCIAKAVSNALA
jgi:hypothetical protein